MKAPAAFQVGIAYQACDQGRLVTDRIALRQQTCVLQKDPRSVLDREKKERYRDSFLRQLRNACGKRDDADKLIESFVQMAETLDAVKAIALHIADNEDIVLTDTDNNQDAGTFHALLHPLSIALLAYRMGGAVNAANTTHFHEWKSQGNSAAGIPDFHAEGDSSDIFDEYRITLVWETHNSRWTRPSGSHNFFLAGADTPQPLMTLSAAGQNNPASPMTIVYNSRKAALWYDCQNTEATRCSISLDFHVNTITNEDLEIFSTPDLIGRQVKEPALSNLITQFPVQDYADAFHRLLFTENSFEPALDMLTLLDVPVQPPQSPGSQDTVMERRYQVWRKANQNSIPAALRGVRDDLPISGIHNNSTGFTKSVCYKALQDVHLSVGMDLVPQSPVDAEREYARRFIRDQPGVSTYRKLVQYEQYMMMPYTSEDLISTSTIREVGHRLKTRCFELTSVGFIDSSFLLPAIGSLSFTLANALDGEKEVTVASEPWVTDESLQLFRTRSLYLFWCADWLARYLGNPQKGLMMVREVQDAVIVKLREDAVHMARVLLRNWVAWALFVDTLPKGGFRVRLPTDCGV
ncbi:hypothetical protein BU25DRAFT_467476 [Macroventuria anomochaeta]|uniref:Uncharacterized protein n=1 Tax=Macroventuria anomochaeta TaxID=301207 RepID=A0ACB6S2E8_9PLEO|nr:uncharacterized protein BU25DRAFT_467476 [Macroventuria anomochaeta]KAF2628142.1 hypothetical protein BU25DRAFT_467476 [Macroventuria anomochaeta]